MATIIGGGSGGSGAVGGANSATGAGGKGGGSFWSAGGGAGATGGDGGDGPYIEGGAGGQSPGADGAGGQDDTGGGGGAHGFVGASLPVANAKGGNGGNGGYDAGGGAGGYGAVVTGSGSLGAVVTSVTGGNGGNGSVFGGGGLGGVGLWFDGSSAKTVTIASLVTGGKGGSGGAPGSGGEGVVGENLNLTLSVGGSITGGTTDNGLQQANAITFGGSSNTLTLAGGTISGKVVANGSNDSLLLAGTSSGSFNVGNIGSVSQYQGFETLGSAGSATWTLTGTNASTQSWSASSGKLLVDGTMTNTTFSVGNGATLGGTGTVGAVTVQSGGAVNPGNSPGILNSGNFSNTSGTLTIEIAGTTVGTQYDQINVTGTVTLGGTLNLSLINPFVPTVGNSFIIINNDASDLVTGTFAGLDQGATFAIGGQLVQISYTGGTGNDVVLTAISNNTAPTLGANMGQTLAEGASATITPVLLDFNDAEQADTSIIYTITSGATNGTVFRDSVALGVNGTFTQADISNKLITYTHNGGETTTAGFGFSVSDGQGGNITGQSFNITVTPVNDAPTMSGLPSDIPVTSGTASNLDLSAVTIGDVDAGANPITVTLTASAGTLAATSSGNVTVSGTGTGTVSLSGTVTDINAFLDTASNVTFTSASGVYGDNAATLTVKVNDGGNTGSGGAIEASASANLDVQEARSLIVTTKDDVVDAFDGKTSLREAVNYANDKSGADTITFDKSVFTGGANSLIRLTQGEITITDAVTIDGSTGAGVTITGDKNDDDITVSGTDITDVKASLTGDDRLDDNSRIFNITSANADTTLEGLTLTGGHTSVTNGGGGAVRSLSTLSLTNSTVSGNSTAKVASEGGGISGINVTLANSTVSGNSTTGAGVSGGGIFGSTIALTNSTLSGNSTAGNFAVGGGIYGINVTLTNSTVSGNSTAGVSGYGGGIFGSDVTLTNSTVSGNSTAGFDANGGSIYGGTVTLTNSTVSGNSTAGSSSEGGGIYSTSSVTLTNSIVLGNDSAQTASDEVLSLSFFNKNGLNIVGTGSDVDGSDGIINADPTNVFAQTTANGVTTAGVLANNGGPVQTIALKAFITNPALDASNTSAPATDATGQAAVDIANVGNSGTGTNIRDLGAFEVNTQEARSLIVTTKEDVVDAFDGKTSLREAVNYANDKSGADTISFDKSFKGGADSLIRLTQGEITITDAVTIDGSTGAGVTITGDKNDDDITVSGTDITDVKASLTGDDRLDDNSRIFNITSKSADTTLESLTLTGGRTTADNELGGAVRSSASLTLTDSVVSGNSTAGFGANGGGIYGGSTVALTNSTVSGNSTAGDAAFGGGIYGHTTFTLTNSTVSGNSTAGSASDGGGIYGGSVTLTNSTVSGNSTAGTGADGGGIYGATVALTNSIVLGNNGAQTPFDEIRGTVTANGHNIVGTGSDTNANDGIINADPTNVFAQTVDIGGGVLAGVLANNGGPVQTIALKASITNPALDASNTSAPTTDARGAAATNIPGVGSEANVRDLGAFEFVNAAPTKPADKNAAANTIAENSAANSLVGITASSTDGDGQAVTYTLTDDAGGAFKIDSATGVVSVADASKLDYEALGPSHSLSITVSASDGFETSTDTFTINVTDVGEAATISGTKTGAVAEDGTLNASGTLTVQDQDAGEAKFQTPSSLAGTYGSFSFNTDTGAWDYELANGAANVQALTAADTKTDTLVVKSSDGTATETITVTITGKDDNATITGTNSGAVAEDGTLKASGALSVQDVDAGQAKFQTPSSLAGTYGSFIFDADTGQWSYDLNNTSSNVQALKATDTVTDTLTVMSSDGTATETITVTISGKNDNATISGTQSGAVSEDGTLKASGALSVQDVDAGQDKFQTPSSLAGTYGSFTFDADTGAWAYDLNNTASNVQALKATDTVTDTLTVTSSDGTATETITVTISGKDDSATISGTQSGAVSEDGTLKASGALSVQDVDAGQAKFQTPSSLAGTYGSFIFDADTGQWSYDLNNTSSNVQALKASDTVTDTLTVKSSDGTATETITVTISGKNDALTGVPTAVLAAGTEDTSYSVKASDLLQGFSDIDGDRLTIASISVNHGTLTPGGGGKGDPDYIFTPDANYNGLVTLTYSVTDGTVSLANQTQTFNLTSVNDAPSGANKTITTNEDTAYTFKAADFAFTDVENNALKSVKISSLPTAGTLTLNGAAVIADQVIAVADITKLVFTPAANANGAGRANFNFYVQDTGGTTNGGFDTDASANTITLNVTAVNDAPTAVVASNVRGPIAENASTAAAIKFADLDITDVDGGSNVLSLSGADASLFQILNGDLYLKAGAKLDFETNPKLDVTVIVNDASVGGAIDAQKALSFSVTDIIESYIGTSKANVLTGTASDETFIGNGGADKMTGGGGRDTFVFKTLTDTAAGSPSFITNPTIAWQSGLGLRDVITDFTPGNDKIDLSLIDASSKLSGNQAFAFNGTGAFSSNPGSLIYRVFDLAGTANDRTIVYADVNGDRLADMQIELTGLKTLQATDFVL